VVVVSILYLGLEISTELMFMREGRISIRQTKQYKVSISIGISQEILAGIDKKGVPKTDLEKAEDIEAMYPNLPMVFWQAFHTMTVEEQPSNVSGQVQVKDLGGGNKVLVVP
jgi:hypothetical protein